MSKQCSDRGSKLLGFLYVGRSFIERLRLRKGQDALGGSLGMVQNTRKKQVWLIDGRIAFVSSSWMPRVFSPKPKPTDERDAVKEAGPVREKPSVQPSGEIYVMGSGLVYVPEDRLNEIPEVIREHHKMEANLAMLTVMLASRR